MRRQETQAKRRRRKEEIVGQHRPASGLGPQAEPKELLKNLELRESGKTGRMG